MLPLPSSFAAISAAFIFPALAGLLIVAAAAKFTKQSYISAFALGIYFWFFSDTLGGSANLDVSAGFSGGPQQLVLFALFVIGVLLPFAFDRTVFEAGHEDSTLGLAIPMLVAVAVGIHGFGEGAAFISAAGSTSSSDLLVAFGGLTAAVAFVLHKLLEPMMVGAVYAAYAKNHIRGMGGLARQTLLLTIAFSLPGIVGAATNYSLNYDATYAFALGLGTSIYAAVRLTKQTLTTTSFRSDSLKVGISFVLGFTCIYLAALLHS